MKDLQRKNWKAGVEQGTVSIFQFLELIRLEDDEKFLPQTIPFVRMTANVEEREEQAEAA